MHRIVIAGGGVAFTTRLGGALGTRENAAVTLNLPWLFGHVTVRTCTHSHLPRRALSHAASTQT